MPELRPTVLALLLSGVLVGCGGGTSSPAPSEPTSSAPTTDKPSLAASSEPVRPGRAIPDGSYAKTVTLSQANALGITDRGFLSELAKDGKTTFVFKFEGDRYTQFGVEEEVPEPGDLGTLQYGANKDVAMTSESDGCPGCVYTYDWSLDGNELTLELVGHESTDTPEGVLIVRLVTEGAFTRQS